MRYAVVIQKTADSYAVQVPDIPGCIVSGRTPEEAMREAALAIALRIEVLQEEGLPLPLPSTRSAYVEVAWELNRLGVPSLEQVLPSAS
jgi:predicted RNase H-like HicB family nuclease